MTHPGQDNPQPAPAGPPAGTPQPAPPTQAAQLPPVPPPGAAPQPPPAQPQPYQSWGPGQPAQPPHPQPGQPQPGQPPYAAQAPQPGQPPYAQPGQPPYQAWGPGQTPPGAVVQPKSSGAKKWGSIAGAVAIAGGLAALRFTGGFGLFDDEPDIGDCVQTTAEQSFETVDCDSADAEYKIIGKESGQSTYEDYLADEATCSDFPDAVAAGWYGDEGEKGTVFCAGPV